MIGYGENKCFGCDKPTARTYPDPFASVCFLTIWRGTVGFVSCGCATCLNSGHISDSTTNKSQGILIYRFWVELP